jgi:hypothetical protein
MNKCIIGLAGLAAFATGTANAATTVFANDFESGFVDPDGTFASAGAVTIAQGSAYTAAPNSFTGTEPFLSNHFATFGSNNVQNPGTLLSATIATIANTLYTINFQYGAIGSAGDTTQSLLFTASDASGGRDTQLFKPVASSNLNTVFNPYKVSFFGNGTSLALNFVSSGVAGDNADLLLDNVLVRAGAVPETSTWAMMIFGLGTVGGVMRRFRRSSSKGALAHA